MIEIVPEAAPKAPTELETEEALDPALVSIIVRSQEAEVNFKAKRERPLMKLMSSFCRRQGKNPNSVRFIYDGQRLKDGNTPDELEMEDGDVIEAQVVFHYLTIGAAWRIVCILR